MIRRLGMIVLAAAAAAAAYDAFALITGRADHAAKVGDWWAYFHRNSLLLLQPAIERHVEPYLGQWLWDPVVLTILTSPAWLVLGILGLVLVLLGGRRSREARHSSR
ncbi:MAG: hypothetical protein R3D62_14610 [Xanthobacteraceae bacterium]